MKTVFIVAYVAFTLCGASGAFWISDEFDQERLWFYGFCLIPAGILFPFSFFFYGRPQSSFSLPRRLRLPLCFIMLGNLWGILLLLNALSGDQRVTYMHLSQSRAEQKSLRVAYRRGGLGLLYRLRW